MAEVKVNQKHEEQKPAQTSMARTGGGQAVAPRSYRDPFDSFLSPSEFFRTNPFALMRRMNEEMERMFGEWGGGQSHGRYWSPAIDAFERDGKYVVHAELPGLNKDDVKVEISDDAIVLQGERKFEHEDQQNGVHRTERRYGQFYRSIPLPEGVNGNEAKARFENGILEISMPAAERKPNSREVPIEAK